MEKVIRDIRRRVELNEPLRTIDIGQIVKGDMNADRFVLELLENGKPLDLGEYSVSGMFLNAIGVDVPITGEVEGNVLTATLGRGCYEVRGMAGGFLRVANGDATVVRTIIRFTTDVLSDGTGIVYDPDKVIGNIAELMAKIAAMEDATRDARLATQEVREALGSAGNAQVAAIRQAGAEQVAAAKTEGAAQMEAIEQKGEYTKNSIPADYTTLAQDVSTLKDTKADVIEIEAAGHTIVLNDSSEHAVRRIAVNGEDSGDAVKVFVYGKNLWKFAPDGSADRWTVFINNQPLALPAGMYTLSFENDSKGSHNINFTGADGTAYNWRPSAAQRGRISNTFEFLTDIVTVNWVFNDNTPFDVRNIQIEYGADASEYMQYNEPQTIDIDANSVVENPKIHTNLRGTTIFNDGGAEMSVVYSADLKTFVQNAAQDGNASDWISYGLPVLALNGDTLGMNKDTSVTLAYEYRASQYVKRTGNCTVKWQGSSSIGFPKKNYTIKFDSPFEAKSGWGSQQKYCFKANWIDASHLRNLVSAKKWGEIVKSRSAANEKLNALINGGAVDGFPCIITINGKFAGLYTFNIPKDGWMFGMGSGTNEAILCADLHVAATQFKGTATLSGDFELEYVTDDDNAAWVTNSLNRLITACMQSDGSDLDTTIAQYLDWDSAIDYYIFTCLLKGADMTDKNYLLSTFDGTKWFFSAYDLDSVYGLKDDGSVLIAARDGVSFYDYATVHRVMHLIYTYKKTELKARYAQLRSGAMSEDGFAITLENFGGKFPEEAYAADRRKWHGLSLTSVNNANQIRDWYRRRVAWLDAEINSL